MTTLRQIRANQQNAQKSTGPRTDEGKERARQNALKHGLTGAGVVQSDDDAALVQRRLQTFRPDFEITNEQQEFQFQRLVLCSVRADRCARDELALRTRQARRAAVAWDDDRKLDAEVTAASLSRRPSLIAQRLTGTRHGCEWMLERWSALEAAARAGSAWDEAQTSLALDLLGVPHELRSVLGFDSATAPATLAAREIARLEARLADGLVDLDEDDRDLAISGQELSPSRDRLRLQKYETASMNEYYKLRTLLHAGTSAKGAEPADPPAPPPPVAPEPPAEPSRALSSEEYHRAQTIEFLRRMLTDPVVPSLDRDGEAPQGMTINSLEEFRVAMGYADKVKQRDAATTVLQKEPSATLG